MNGFDLPSFTTAALLLAPQGITATGTGTLTPDVTQLIGRGSFAATVGSVTAGGTLAITLEHADTVGGTYTPVSGAVINITAANANSIARSANPVNIDALKPFIRVSYVAGGATPTINVAVTLFGVNARRD